MHGQDVVLPQAARVLFQRAPLDFKGKGWCGVV